LNNIIFYHQNAFCDSLEAEYIKGGYLKRFQE